ncbi:MAG: hypothetical protein ACRD0E_10505 [Acidimicrobiales bacterium]
MVALRYGTDRPTRPTCSGPGCDNPLPAPTTGRPGIFCSVACRVRSHREHHRSDDLAVGVEVDMGSASSRGRLPDQAWMVRLRRGERSVIVHIGLRRHAADRLAEQLSGLLGPNDGTAGR